MPTISCSCGQSKVDINKQPLLRIICHCTICQEFHHAPQADLAILRSRDVRVHEEATINYQRMRKPPAVDRGTCDACSEPVVEFLQIPLMPKLAFVSAQNLQTHMTLEPPALRAFYNRRLTDAQDDIPRYEGYWPSQLAMMRYLLPALLH